MSIKDKLQIILITYNRAKHVKKTFEQFFFEGSPVSDCEFIVQDNNSTDNTREIVEEFAKTHSNVKYVKNKYNLGLSGTIARAMEYANKEYVWIIGDDDIYDFSNFDEVEKAINNDEKMICISRYAIPDDKKDNIAYQLFQLTFITGGIYSTSLFNDTTIRNAFDNIYTLFPHLLPIIKFINDGGKIYVTDKAVADNGFKLEEKDCSYIRGIKNASELSKRTVFMTWILGYCNTVNLLNNKGLVSECIERAISYPDIFKTLDNFFEYLLYLENNHISYFYEIFPLLNENKQKQYIESKPQLETWKNRVSKISATVTFKEAVWLLFYKIKKIFVKAVKNVLNK